MKIKPCSKMGKIKKYI